MNGNAEPSSMPSGMKSRPLSVIRAERTEAALESDLTRLERLLFEGAEHSRGQEECLLPLGRLHDERGRKDEAASLLGRLFTLTFSPEGALHLLRLGAEDAGAARDCLDQAAPGAAETLDRLDGVHDIGESHWLIDQVAMRKMETPTNPDEHRRWIADDAAARQIQNAMLSQSEAMFGQ